MQTNFGGVLTINGAPVGRELGQYYLKDSVAQTEHCKPQAKCMSAAPRKADGSIIIVIATDAPVDARNLKPDGGSGNDGTRSHRRGGKQW